MKHSASLSNLTVPMNLTFPVRNSHHAWEQWTSQSLFEHRTVLVFGLPGAFTPTCSSSHLPRYEQLYDLFRAHGIDEIYCMSVNDTFVMNAWAQDQGIQKVKMLPDGNGELTQALGMKESKAALGFGDRSWRFAMIVQNGVILHSFVEPDQEGDPFVVSDADSVLKAWAPHASIPPSVTVFTKPGCPYCAQAKSMLSDHGLPFYEFSLNDADRQKALQALTGQSRPTVPQIFIEGQRIGGSDELQQYFQSHQ